MAKPNDTIAIQDFNMGGLAKSRWSGNDNTLFKLIGFDPHSKPGVLDVAQKLTKVSGSTITELCLEGVNSSNGSQYFFSHESGKVWEITSAGVVRLVYTTLPSLGTANCLGAAEHEGYIYWATSKKLHRIAVASADDNNWSADVAANWAEFTAGDSDFHPMLSHTATLTLYIGDGKYLAQVDNNIFSAEALDIRDPLRIKSLGSFSTDVLLGTFVSDNFTQTEILRWNTWDDSFVNSDKIPEVGINAFINADNVILVQAGKSGNIYWYDGTNLELYNNIPGEYSPTAYGEVHPSSVANMDGQMLMGWSNQSGSPTDSLVYRIARHDRDFNYILDAPYPISQRSGDDFVLSGIEIGVVLSAGSYIFVAWKHGSTCGVDKLDASNKLSGAYFESRIMIVDRGEFTNFAECFINVTKRTLGGDLFPSGTAISFYLSKNYGAYGAALATEIDTETVDEYDQVIKGRNVIRSKDEGDDFTTLQLRVKVTTSGNEAPLIESGGVKIR